MTTPDDADKALFREATNGTRRLRNDRLPLPHKRPRASRPRLRDDSAQYDDATDMQLAFMTLPESMELEEGEELQFKRPGLPSATFRRLKRGLHPIEGELDLHGYTRSQAQLAVAEFLRDAKRCDARCLRIIHGRGLNSRHGPILKRKLAGWLQCHPQVLAFTTATPADGGNGAVYVLLRSR